MDKGLSYQLGVDYKNAMKELEGFMKQAKKRMEEEFTINVDFKSRGGKGGSGGRSSALSEAEREQKDFLKNQERDKQRSEKIYRDMVAKIRMEEQRLGSSLIAERQKTMDKLQNMLSQGLKPDTFRRRSAEAVGMYSQQVQYNTGNVSAQKQIDDQRIASAQRTANRLEDIQRNAVYRLESIEMRGGQELAEIRQNTEARIQSIVRNSGNQRLSEVQRQVNREIRAYRSMADAMSASSGMKGGVSNKSIGAVFQVQQAIEDYSYAGLRGAGNNIAMLAATIGGPAGLVALLGIMGATLVPTTMKLIGFGDAAGSVASRVGKLVEQIDSAFKNNQYQNSSLFKGESGFSKLTEEVRTAKTEIAGLADARGKYSELSGLVQQYRNLAGYMKTAEYASRMGPMQFGMDFGVAGAIENGERALDKLVDKMRAIDPDFIDWFELNRHDIAAVDELLKRLKENTAALSDEERKQLAIQKQRLDLMRELEQSQQRIADMFRRAGIAGLSKSEMEAAYETDPDKIWSMQYEKSMAALTEIRNREAQLAADAKKAGDFAGEAVANRGFLEAAEEMQKLVEENQKRKEIVEATKKAEDALKNAEQEALRTAKEQLQIHKQKNKEIEQEIKNHKKVLEELKKQSDEQKNSFAMSGFDTMRSMSSNRNNYYAEQTKKAMGLHLSPNQDYVNMVGGQIDAYYASKAEYEAKFLNKAQQAFMTKQANFASNAGDHSGERDLLESLQSFQMNQAASAKTPAEQDYWWKKALETQKQIEITYIKQANAEQDKIDKLKDQIKNVSDLEKKVKDLETAVTGLPKIDLKDPSLIPWLAEVEARLKALRDLSSKLPNAADNPAMKPFLPNGGVPPQAANFPRTPNLPQMPNLPQIPSLAGGNVNNVVNQPVSINGPINFNMGGQVPSMPQSLASIRQSAANWRLRNGV